MKLPKYLIEITVFVCGAIVMIFELLGSRVLGPYFGTSIFVWTSLIGIILGSLSLGYYLGGKIADKNPSIKNFSMIIFVSAIAIFLSIIVKDYLLVYLFENIKSIKVSSFISSIILFAPASILLGMVSPYAAKLKLENIKNTGQTVGNLYALSTLGSIVGTFLSGFYLIPYFGTNILLVIIAIVLVLNSIALNYKFFTKIKIIFLVLLFVFIFNPRLANLAYSQNNIIDIDTTYNRVWIYDGIDKKTDRDTRSMLINNENSSATYLDNNDLVFEYTKFYDLAKYYNPDFKKTLMIGGAGYSYPKYFLEKYPDATIDVVEIDPELTNIAKEYFNLDDNERLAHYHEDGRVFLNKNTEKYDVIFGDAFSSYYSIPYQLTTKEAIDRHYDSLTDDGVVILNIISSVEGDSGKFLRAEYTTYKSVFPYVDIYLVNDKDSTTKVQNIILVASKTDKRDNDINENVREYLKHKYENDVAEDMPILTDDYAPVDYYINQILK